jgi:RNA 2',3'-cyclic 3'-phosphodiesterase
MRMFVAVDLDEATRAVVAQEQRSITRRVTSSSIRLVEPAQVHLTLAFLGEVAPPLSDQVTEAMRQPFTGIAPFRLALGGVGMFPPRGAPRILWLGLIDGARPMITLQAAVARRLDALGVTLEDRAFSPHVTIGRWRDARPSDRRAVENIENVETVANDPSRGTLARMLVDHVTLFESRLSSKGASHFPLAEAQLSTSS